MYANHNVQRPYRDLWFAAFFVCTSPRSMNTINRHYESFSSECYYTRSNKAAHTTPRVYQNFVLIYSHLRRSMNLPSYLKSNIIWKPMASITWETNRTTQEFDKMHQSKYIQRASATVVGGPCLEQLFAASRGHSWLWPTLVLRS